MPSVSYTKKRSIASGASGDAEALDFNASEIVPGDKVSREELETMGKAVSAVVKNIMQVWRVTTVPVTYSTSNVAIWREFLHSVAGREQFQFDPTGTEANPGSDIRTVTLASKRITYSRSGLGPNLMTISMEFEETV